MQCTMQMQCRICKCSARLADVTSAGLADEVQDLQIAEAGLVNVYPLELVCVCAVIARISSCRSVAIPFTGVYGLLRAFYGRAGVRVAWKRRVRRRVQLFSFLRSSCIFALFEVICLTFFGII